MLVSPDGISWRVKEDALWHPSPPDPLTSVFRNDVRDSYVITTRPEGGDRRIAVIETRDWKSYTQPELALQTDALDAPLTQAYGMAVIPYEGYYIGLLWLFHCIPEPPNKYLGGHMDCQLAYSLNGWHFQRGPRDPFIPNGPPGDPDSGTVYPSCMVPQEDGSLWFYASACTMEHGNLPAGDTGSLVAYSMRRDGFIYLESTGGRGTVGTRARLLARRRGEHQRPGPGWVRTRAAVRRRPYRRRRAPQVRYVAPGGVQLRGLRALLRRRRGLDSPVEGRKDPIPDGGEGAAARGTAR